MKKLTVLIITISLLVCINTANATYISHIGSLPFDTAMGEFTVRLIDDKSMFRLTTSDGWNAAYKFKPRHILRWDIQKTQQYNTWLDTLRNTLKTAGSTSTNTFLATSDVIDFSSHRTQWVDIRTRTSPVPEPGTLLLFGTGLICLADLRRRYKEIK